MLVRISDQEFKKQYIKVICLCFSFFSLSCSSPNEVSDKTVAGGALGAGWGAGAGAIIGHQLSYAGEGAAIGAGFGLLSGATSGYAYDQSEAGQAQLEREFATLQMQNSNNAKELARIHGKLDRNIKQSGSFGIQEIYFDPEASILLSGSLANLEVIANNLRQSPNAERIVVAGHADDSISPEENAKLAQARASTVSAYLMSRGISADQIIVKSFGSQRPMASASIENARVLNRRVDIYIEHPKFDNSVPKTAD